MTDEEYHARAMLLGMEYCKNDEMGNPLFRRVFRKRVGDGGFAGTALFSYFYADTLEPVETMRGRSEVDMTLQEMWNGRRTP